jgi:hypothetical protein
MKQMGVETIQALINQSIIEITDTTATAKYSKYW